MGCGEEMTHLGLNVDPLNVPHGNPEPALLVHLNLSWVRLVARPGVQSYVTECRAAGLKVLGVLARESFVDGWDVARYTRQFQVDTWQLGNEPDGAGESSWSATPTEYRRWHNLAAQQARQETRVPIVAAGLCSGQPNWLTAAWPLDCDAIAIHPYGKDADTAATLLDQYRQVAPDKPLWVTEWNRPAEQISAFLTMLRGRVAVACWFTWSDGQVEPFGLVDTQRRAKSEFYAMRDAIQMYIEEHIEALEGRVNSLEQRDAWKVEFMWRLADGDPRLREEAARLAKAMDPEELSRPKV